MGQRDIRNSLAQLNGQLADTRRQFLETADATEQANLMGSQLAMQYKAIRLEAAAAAKATGIEINSLINISKQFESQEMPNFPRPVPIVLGGGGSMVNGFIEVFKEQFTQQEFPLNISEIRLVDEPLTAVSRGCYLEAKLDDED